MSALELVQAVCDGLLFGATYAVIGIGFTLIFGVMHKLNMAYAAASLAGAYAGLVVLHFVQAPALVVFFLAGAAAGGFGLTVYLCCFRFIPLTAPLAPLMATIGMLMLIDESVVQLTEGMPLPYPVLFDDVMFHLGELTFRGDLLLVFGVGLACMGLMLFLLYRTRLGLATRAVAQQPIAAQLCGVRLTRVNALTFVLAGLFGGIAAAMIGASVGTLSPLLMLPVTIKGLIVAVIGGLGSIPGAIVAGLLVGAFENLFQFLRGVTERDIYVMLLLFVFLVFRPGGVFAAGGRRD
jgi:branched-chain amino acid transport system permease protein